MPNVMVTLHCLGHWLIQTTTIQAMMCCRVYVESFNKLLTFDQVSRKEDECPIRWPNVLLKDKEFASK